MAFFGHRKAPIEDVEDAVEEESGAEEEEQETQAPQYATIEQMQTLIEAQGKQMQATLTQLLTPQQEAAVEDDEPELPAEISDEEILEAMEEGDNKKALRLQRQQRERDKLISQREIRQLRKESASGLSNVQKALTTKELAEYGKYQKEIDNILATFPTATRGTPEVIKFVYDSVRGRHIDEEIDERANQLIEQRKRQANLDPTDEPSGRRSMVRGQGEDDDNIVSANADQVLRQYGRSYDQVAQGLGYENWADYVKSAKAYDKKPVHRWTTTR